MSTVKFSDLLRRKFKELVNITDQVDTLDAAQRIKSAIWFRGPNVWILAFSIIVASVGLNVNSTAVIIGAMLISPLMGPIIGLGLGLGTNDMKLLRDAGENLLVMVLISILVSTLYFLVSPLNLVNPTELLARTSPTIYDVLIALFGGLAGILENSRKERGTVLSGVAIATALMPPLCTAGYGLSHGEWHYFFGALYLFLINGVFIILATFFMVKYLHFEKVEQDAVRSRRAARVISFILVLFIVPSVLSAVDLVRSNNFDRKVSEFVAENRSFARAYIYDYRTSDDHKTVDLYLTGDSFDATEMEQFLLAASRHGLTPEQVNLKEHSFGLSEDKEYEAMVKGIYARADEEVARKDRRIKELETEVETLRDKQVPYRQVGREVRFKYPIVKDLTIARGASVLTDSLSVRECLSVLVQTTREMTPDEMGELTSWLKVRLNDTTVVVKNMPFPQAQDEGRKEGDAAPAAKPSSGTPAPRVGVKTPVK